MIFARAKLEKAKVTETYEVEQSISANPSRRHGSRPTGSIEVTVPYDGERYFTRQAVHDVEQARSGPKAATDPDAAIGHLVLADHDQVESLPDDVRMRAEFGVLALTAALPGTADLTAGRSACVITNEYQPRYPRIVPAALEIDVMDPDDFDLMSLAEALADSHEQADGDEAAAFYAKMAGEIRQRVSFQSMLMMRIKVRLFLPRNADQVNMPTQQPIVRRIAIDWPTITSLRTTDLEVYAAVHQDGKQVQETAWQRFPVRYNPVDRRLEWEVLGMGRSEAADGAGARTIDYESPPMRLLIRHPGELYRTPKLKVRAEIEIPGYLMSGLDPRFFDATGMEVPSGTDKGHRTLPALTTRVTVNGTLTVDDSFAKRYFSPHHSVIFDDIIPDEARVGDIRTVLRNLGFNGITEVWSTNDADAPEWFLRAQRSQGPDQMDLWVYVEGTRYTLERQQIMGDNNVKQIRSTISGQIRLHMLGRLPRDHREMTREMNALHKELRNRYQYHTVSQR